MRQTRANSLIDRERRCFFFLLLFFLCLLIVNDKKKGGRYCCCCLALLFLLVVCHSFWGREGRRVVGEKDARKKKLAKERDWLARRGCYGGSRAEPRDYFGLKNPIRDEAWQSIR